MTGAQGSGSRAARALGALALVLPFLAALALPVVTTERMAVPPFAPVAFSAVALVVAAALGGGEGRRPWDLPVAALLGLAAGHLLLAPGLPRGHDLIPHIWGAWGFVQEVRGGDFFPRWLHRVGLGMPLTQFYGPVSFYLMLPLAALGLPHYAVFKGVFVVAGMLAAATLYLAVSRWTGDRRAALVAAAGYAFAPYRLLDSNYRIALGESVAFVLLPPLFLSVRAALRLGGRRRWALAAVAAALLVAVHPLSAVMAAVALGAWACLEALLAGEGWRTALRHLAGATGIFALGIALAGFFVLPLAAETRFTSLERMVEIEGAPRIAEHGLRPAQLGERRLWRALLVSEPAGSPQDADASEMPFYMGLGLLSLAPLAAGVGRLRGEERDEEAGRERRRLGRVLALLAVGSLLLTLGPAARLMARLPVLPTLQFSWRFLAIASFALAAAAGLATARLLAAWGRRPGAVLLPGLVAALLVADGFPYTGAPDWVGAYRGLVHFHRLDPAASGCGGLRSCWHADRVPPPYPLRVAGSFLPPAEYSLDVSGARPGYPEYFNPEVRRRFADPGMPEDFARWGVGVTGGPGGMGVTRHPAMAYARWLPGAPRGAWESPGSARPFRRGGGRIEVELDGRPGTVVVLEQFFPGWEAGTAAGWREASATAEGLLRAAVAPGQRRLVLRFSGRRWDRAGGWLLTAVTALLLFAPLPGRWRRRPRPRLPGREAGTGRPTPAGGPLPGRGSVRADGNGRAQRRRGSAPSGAGDPTAGATAERSRNSDPPSREGSP